MNECSCYAYRENLVAERHNKKTGISGKEAAALMEKGRLDDCHMDIIKALDLMGFAGRGHIRRYMGHARPEMDVGAALAKKLKQLCDYGIAMSACFYQADDSCGYRTCNIYSLTSGGRDMLAGTGGRAAYRGGMDSAGGIAEILNRAAFNSFYVGSLSYNNIKYYFSYSAGREVIEGRLVARSDKYPEGLVNICVIPVRRMEGGSAGCALKISAAQEHFGQKRIKKPWFVIVCEDDAHERDLYGYLKGCRAIEEAVICMTKDTYLVRGDADAFDNITTFARDGKELVSEFKRIIF